MFLTSCITRNSTGRKVQIILITFGDIQTEDIFSTFRVQITYRTSETLLISCKQPHRNHFSLVFILLWSHPRLPAFPEYSSYALSYSLLFTSFIVFFTQDPSLLPYLSLKTQFTFYILWEISYDHSPFQLQVQIRYTFFVHPKYLHIKLSQLLSVCSLF